MALLTVSSSLWYTDSSLPEVEQISYNRFFTIVKEETQSSVLTLQPSAVMVDFELALIQASYIVSDNYTVIRHSGTNPKSIEHYDHLTLWD